MYLARVIGTVVATTKTPGLDGIRLLVVQPVDEDGNERQRPMELQRLTVAADVTQAGPGDLVHVTTSREAALAMPEPFVPVDAAIVAIVDQVHVEHRVAAPTTARAADSKPAKARKAAKP